MDTAKSNKEESPGTEAWILGSESELQAAQHLESDTMLTECLKALEVGREEGCKVLNSTCRREHRSVAWGTGPTASVLGKPQGGLCMGMHRPNHYGAWYTEAKSPSDGADA